MPGRIQAPWSDAPTFGQGEDDKGNLARRMSSPSFVFLCIGLNVLALLMLVPFWNASLMLRNPVFIYFVGGGIAAWIIVKCILVTLAYLVAIPVFFRRASPEAQTEQTLLMLGNGFLTLFGILALLTCVPIRQKADSVAVEIMQSAPFGARTMDLWTASQELQAVRQRPSCRALPSVEQCYGFRQTEYSDLLKHMEEHYKCSGWAYSPEEEAIPKAEVSETESRRLSGSRALPAPPTLFSHAGYTASCEGMVGRNIKDFLEDVADEFYYEGVYLVGVSVIMGFLKIVGFCAKDSFYSRYRDDAAAGSYGAAAQPEKPSTPHYVSQGILQ